MRLVSLSIYKQKNGEVIRNIKFNQDGLSLIVDEDSIMGKSGNDIGKSTFVDIIDICLGSKSIKTIYNDPETGNDEEVLGFLNENKVTAVLSVAFENSATHIFERNLFEGGLESIDGQPIANYSLYCQKLKELIFVNAPSGLTFRQLMPKFIRLNMSSDLMFKFFGTFGSASTYHIAYDYFVGASVSDERSSFVEERQKLIDTNKGILSKHNSDDLMALNKEVQLLKSSSETAKSKVLSKDYIGDFKKDEANALAISEIDMLSSNLYSKKYEMFLLEKRIDKERNKIRSVDYDVLRLLYGDAESYLLNLIKSYEGLVVFHNKMCGTRLDRYLQQKKSLGEEIDNIKQNLSEKRRNFSTHFVDFKVDLNDKSNSEYETYFNIRAKYLDSKNDLDLYETNVARISVIQAELKRTDDAEVESKRLQKRLNELFQTTTNNILGESHCLVFNDDINCFPLTSKGGRKGHGDKKALIACLDFAFAEIFMENKREMPYFIIQDQMEGLSETTLSKLFAYARIMGGQYILPILRDRVTTLGINSKEIILSLSKKDKLFRF